MRFVEGEADVEEGAVASERSFDLKVRVAGIEAQEPGVKDSRMKQDEAEMRVGRGRHDPW